MSKHLSPHDVHVWQAHLDAASSAFDELPSFAPQEELARAGSMPLTVVRARYAASRVFLRTILSSYLEIAPRDIVFASCTLGKPRVVDSDLQFNLTHSEDMALLAVASQEAVGIDTELISPDPFALEIAKRFFSREEHAALCSLPHQELCRAFYATWTRKEAFLKGLGLGILSHLRRCTVSTSPDGPARLIRVDWDPSLVRQWALTDLKVGEGFAACLANRGGPRGIKQFTWPRDCVPHGSPV